MTESIPNPLDSFADAHINCAVVTHELLFELTRVLENNEPAGPIFIDALNALTEACVLFDSVYVLPDQIEALYPGQGWSVYGPIGVPIGTSSFVNMLVKEGVIKLFYSTNEMQKTFPSAEVIVNQIIKNAGIDTDYEFFDYFSKTQIAGVTFTSLDNECNRMEWLKDLIEIPGIFNVDVDTFDEWLRPRPPELQIVIDAAHSRNFSLKDLESITGLNDRAFAIETLAHAMNMNLYVSFSSTPHFINSINQRISFGRQLIARIEKENTTYDDPGGTQLGKLPLPALTKHLLAKVRGSRHAMPNELLELRNRYDKLRRSLHIRDQQLLEAKTIGERKMVISEFENSWKALLSSIQESERHPSWIYRIGRWFAASFKSPGDVLEKLIETGEAYDSNMRFKGLRAFWDDQQAAPLSRQIFPALQQLVTISDDTKLWSDYEAIARRNDQTLGASADI